MPALQKGFLLTSLLEGIPSNKLVYVPARQKGILPTSWYMYQLVRRESFRQAGIKTSFLEGNPSDKLV
jgi:hypothetical protein